MSDDELEEEAVDFSILLNKKNKRDGLKRGDKSFQPNNTSDQEVAIENSREALFELISEIKTIGSNFSFGILNDIDIDNESNNNNNKNEKWLTTVEQKKGTHFQYMGHTVRGNMVLYLEEAAWLLNRYALYVHRKSSTAAITATTATATVNTAKNDNTDSPAATITDYNKTVTFEDYCALMFTSKDNWITYEKYQVYAYLKRLGYIVQRSPSSSDYSSTLSSSPPLTTQLDQWRPKSKSGHVSWYYKFICPFANFCNSIKSVAYILLRSIGLLSKIKPLVCHNQFSDYGTLYTKLQTIYSSPWYQPVLNNTTNYPYSISWDVYKPNPKWKKRDPGIPDFRVVVGNMNDPLPSPDNLNYLFNLLYGLPYNKSAYQPIRNTKSIHSQPAFLMALVSDAEGVTFVRLQADGISSIIKNQNGTLV
ncbi:hypothetical protein BJ944DRAFT_259314 [Cunninghamella echinulata]|nr:hypothetical protein BJ944DRAFT_259314 [Cunninghamella echinulata]